MQERTRKTNAFQRFYYNQLTLITEKNLSNIWENIWGASSFNQHLPIFKFKIFNFSKEKREIQSFKFG